MVAFSSMKNIIDWLFVPNPTALKHQTLAHPLLAFLLGSGINWVLVSKLSDYFTKKYPFLQAKLPPWVNKKALPIMTAYYLILMISRYIQSGPYSLYEMLWACNLAIFMFINGAYRKQVLPIAACLLLIGIDQSLWYVDLLGYIFTKKFIIGVAKYLVWPETTWLRVFTATHHIWFIPLILAACKNLKEYRVPIYIFTYLVSLPMTIIPRLMTPKTLVLLKDKQEIYLNIMCVYELWKDVKSGVFSAFDKSHPIVTTMFSNQGWNACNILIFVIAYFLFPFLKKQKYQEVLAKFFQKQAKKTN